MTVVRRFLVAELLWGAAIFLLILPLTVLGADAGGSAAYARWLARALTLAAFPAGVATADLLFARTRSWRPVGEGVAAAALVALAVFLLGAFIVPSLAGDASLPQLLRADRSGLSWEARNHGAWAFYSILFAPVSVLLTAAIGAQVGIWATHALPAPQRRILYWIVALGLMISSYTIYDSTYESVVLHTAADVSFAPFYTLLVPLGICAGLGLPTLALLRGAEVRGSDL
jgi:hypothetical protein